MNYGIIVIDPPWKAGKGNKRKVRPSPRQQTMDYKLLDLDEIFAIVDRSICKCDDKHNIFIWCIDRMLTDCERKMADRGYKLHARIVWDKGNGIAPAFTLRFSHEYLLWFYKPGKMLKPVKNSRGLFTDVLRAAPREHSRKPDEAYNMIDVMFGDCNKLDMFARESRIGWDTWGDEVTKFDKKGGTNERIQSG